MNTRIKTGKSLRRFQLDGEGPFQGIEKTAAKLAPGFYFVENAKGRKVALFHRAAEGEVHKVLK